MGVTNISSVSKDGTTQFFRGYTLTHHDLNNSKEVTPKTNYKDSYTKDNYKGINYFYWTEKNRITGPVKYLECGEIELFHNDTLLCRIKPNSIHDKKVWTEQTFKLAINRIVKMKIINFNKLYYSLDDFLYDTKGH